MVDCFLLVGSQTQIDDRCSKTRASSLAMVTRALYSHHSHHANTVQEKADLEQTVLKYKKTGSWEVSNPVQGVERSEEHLTCRRIAQERARSGLNRLIITSELAFMYVAACRFDWVSFLDLS